ncbi:M23 family metallopeptidase [Allosphingosinicella vermicomposti]|uniref:M23 family metallopeptidase n=1 Tax=Allosphingosinicella vermicomposti TaxID=614671 RepID=UPI001FE19A27|nr:M23 family metallopeptidase [Allosphingosinicella vermicomposti]
MFWIGAYGNGTRQVEAADVPAARPLSSSADVTLAPAVGASGLAIPVAGVKPEQLADTFTQARAGGERVHDAIDIMAPRGTPVVAAAPGTVEKLYFSEGGGGVTAYVRSPDARWIYYYAHLDRYAPGLAEGEKVERGSPIGFVGSTGNASPDGPHLHFAVSRTAPGESWYQGAPVNPYPLLAGNRTAR